MNRLNLLALMASLVLVLGFQNCSETSFGSKTANTGDSQSGGQGGPDDGPGGPDTGDGGASGEPNGGTGPGGGTTPGGSMGTGGRVVRLPNLIGEFASIAFEDNVNRPDAGDRDYNDAVFNYKIDEIYNSMNQLTRIDIEVRVREKISGNNHRLFLYFNGNPVGDFSNITHVSQAAFNGLADIAITEPDGSQSNATGVNSLIIVPATQGAVGDAYQLQVTLLSPEQNQVASLPLSIDFRKYRFVLQNHGHTQGIDLSEINSTDEMVAQDGYPLGFMVPTNWDPPGEGQLIDNKYPNFQLYRNWLNGDQSAPPSQGATFWFL